MKFYDLEGLSQKCGTDNKYEITARLAARARWLSEQRTADRDLLTNERYLSLALLEVEKGKGGIPAPGDPLTPLGNSMGR
ncbi:MAG: DNA-directed RNA polymerase subunit omega [Synergistaceae bacterium]|nr:DNA-directed RNA polymerase subunit omega [Synergistaceae bacterium]